MDFKTIHLPTVVTILTVVVVLFVVYHVAFHAKGGAA